MSFKLIDGNTGFENLNSPQPLLEKAAAEQILKHMSFHPGEHLNTFEHNELGEQVSASPMGYISAQALNEFLVNPYEKYLPIADFGIFNSLDPSEGEWLEQVSINPNIFQMYGRLWTGPNRSNTALLHTYQFPIPIGQRILNKLLKDNYPRDNLVSIRAISATKEFADQIHREISVRPRSYQR